MNRILLASAILCSGLAHADSNYYASLKTGVSDTNFKNSKDYVTLDGVDPNDFSGTIYNDNVDQSVYPNISAAIGFDFSKISKINARAELEYTYKDKANFSPTINRFEITNMGTTTTDYSPAGQQVLLNQLKSQALMLNGYYDFKNSSKLTPYIGVGLGLTHVKNKQSLVGLPEESFSDTDNHFTWSAGAGVAYNVTENVAFDLGYRYVDAGKMKFKNSNILGSGESIETTADLVSSDYSFGIRYSF